MAGPPAEGTAPVTDGRAAILSRLRSSLASRRMAGPQEARPAKYIRPERAQGDQSDLIARFHEMAIFSGATIGTVSMDDAVPSEIARYLSRENLGDSLILSPSDRIRIMPWTETPRLSVRRAPIGSDDKVSVTEVVAGVAETGTLLVRSGFDSPNLLHLLPEAHIAILDAKTIVGSYEDALKMLGQETVWPRAATFITGPSRTADIEKTPQIGVHGPRRLHIVLIHGEETET